MFNLAILCQWLAIATLANHGSSMYWEFCAFACQCSYRVPSFNSVEQPARKVELEKPTELLSNSELWHMWMIIDCLRSFNRSSTNVRHRLVQVPSHVLRNPTLGCNSWKSCNVWQKIRCHGQPRGLSSLHLLMEFGTSRGAMTRVRTIWWKGRIPLGWGVQTAWTSRKSKDPFKQSLSSRCTPLPALQAYTLPSGCGEKTTAISWNTALQNHVNGWCEEWTTL